MEATRCQPNASAISGDRDQQPQLRVDHEPAGQDGERDQGAQVQHVLAGQHQRVGLDPRRQLEERHDRPGEGHRSDEDADEHLGVVDAERVQGLEVVGLGAVEVGLDVQVAVPADQHRGQTDEGVQQGDQLRHPGHLDHPGPPQADRGTDRGRDQQQREAGALDVPVRGQDDRRDQRDGHAGHPERVADLGGLVMGQPRQRQDEQQSSHDVGRLRDSLDSHLVSSSISFGRTWRASGGSPRSHRRR